MYTVYNVVRKKKQTNNCCSCIKWSTCYNTNYSINIYFFDTRRTFSSCEMNQPASHIITTCTKRTNPPVLWSSTHHHPKTRRVFSAWWQIIGVRPLCPLCPLCPDYLLSRLALLCLGSPPAPNSGIWQCHHYDDSCMWPAGHQYFWIGAVMFWKPQGDALWFIKQRGRDCVILSEQRHLYSTIIIIIPQRWSHTAVD